ncbi:hypothetical protein FSP39_013695 [Pinctada imbricata]|uniref:Uncharacterized protein n=1 Tax=Pinctada imbricata TaxID=66713 RepID=A0AA88XM91_PINIB|nr:hypothetical protein FSP39_013695 [Pinctada imbricata]
MVEVFPLVGLILSAVALVLDIALSFSPMYWYYRKQEVGSVTTETFLGLWRYCSKRDTGSTTTETCQDHNDDSYFADRMFVGGAQVFQCLAFLLLVATIVFLILKMFVLKDKSFLTPLACAHAFWAALCLIASAGTFGQGIKVFNSNNYDFRDDLHFSLAFAVICGIVALVAGIILLVDMIKNK